MSDRKVFYLANEAVRARVCEFVKSAPEGYRVEIKEQKRSLDQNSRLWAMLTDVSLQATHSGRKYEPEIWKCIFMHALGREVKFIPSLEGDSVIPLTYRSSDLSKSEMSELIEFMMAWGTENGVVFHDVKQPATTTQAA